MRLFLSVLLLVFLSACSSDSGSSGIVGPNPDPDPDPNPTAVSFSLSVLPIFTATCSGSGCHVGSATNGVSLGSYANVMGSSGTQYGGPIVIAGNSANSPIIDKLGSSPRFGARMPLNSGSLSISQVQTIASWIDAGAANN